MIPLPGFCEQLNIEEKKPTYTEKFLEKIDRYNGCESTNGEGEQYQTGLENEFNQKHL